MPEQLNTQERKKVQDKGGISVSRYGTDTSGSSSKSFFSSDILNVPDQISSEEIFTLNTGYLITILKLVDEFCFIKVNGYNNSRESYNYFLLQWEIIDMINTLLAPKLIKRDKIRKKDFDDRIDNMIEFIDKIYQQTDNGLFVNKTQTLRLRRQFTKLFEDQIIAIEDLGMLTLGKENPMKAMGKFYD
jgi:hypothetical protein